MPGIVDMGRSLRGQALQSMGELSAAETQRANFNRALRGQRSQALGQGLGTAGGLAVNYALNHLPADKGIEIGGELLSSKLGLAVDKVPAAFTPVAQMSPVTNVGSPVAEKTAEGAAQAASSTGIGTTIANGAYAVGDAAAKGAAALGSSSSVGAALVNGAYAVGNAAGSLWTGLLAIL